MNWAGLKARLSLACSRGGAAATAWWISRKVLRSEFYWLMACSYPAADKTSRQRSAFDFRCVARREDVTALSGETLTALETQTRDSLVDLTDSGARVYYLASGEAVACQLLVSFGPEVRTDVPPGLILDAGVDGAFISYVYTHATFRRMGAARELLQQVGEDLDRGGVRLALAHVSVTNVPSLRAFSGAGWKKAALLGFTRGGKLLFATRVSRQQISVRSDR